MKIHDSDGYKKQNLLVKQPRHMDAARGRITLYRLCGVFVALWCLCGAVACSGEQPKPPGPCQGNKDCAGSQICVSGQCTYPPQESDVVEKNQEALVEQATESIQTEAAPESPVESGQESVEIASEKPETSDASEGITEPTESMPEESTDTQPTDTSLGCKTGETRPCYSGSPETEGEGVCIPGKQTCKDGFWDVVCAGEVLPSLEECNGKDDNCDGTIDETYPEQGNVCQVAGKFGPCAQGTSLCQNGKLVCHVTYQPQAEDCSNKIDDDCDGKVDGPPCTCNIGETRECFSGDPRQANQGECRKGRQVCDSNGQWGSCVGDVLPTTELCNGKDDDCDGSIDETFPEKGRACTDTRQKGICQQGVYTTCTNGVLVCESQVKPLPVEICGNGKDDNCDGAIDENPPCQCLPGLPRSCYTGRPGTENFRPCQRGVQTCDARGQWGTCIGEVLPQPEKCDGIDNDCNGYIDDNLQQICTSTCGKGIETCVAGKWVYCSAPQPSTEVCDGKDNDCDGYIDNQTGSKQNNTLTQSCSNKCGKGVETCSNGQWVNCTAPSATTEICDGKDNDCDGLIDDNIRVECYETQDGGCVYDSRSGQWSCKGTCKTGFRTCKNGVLDRLCSGDVTARTEQCRDNLDNDCDGLIDEICGANYTYAVVSSGGTLMSQYLMSKSTRTATGTYQIVPSSTAYDCANRPIFTSVQTSGMMPTSYSCTSSSDFQVVIGASATRTGTLADMGFHAVVPRKESDTIWGRVSCFLSNCTASTSYGTFTATYVSTGIVDITSTYCTSASTPVFSTIYSSKIVGYTSSYVFNSKCRIRTYDLNGNLATLPFAFWVPNVKTTAWATVSSTGTISYSYDFGDKLAKWSSQILKDTLGNYQYNSVLFPAWSSKSAFLISGQVGLPVYGTGIPTTGGVNVYMRNVTDAKLTANAFSIMFVQ